MALPGLDAGIYCGNTNMAKLYAILCVATVLLVSLPAIFGWDDAAGKRNAAARQSAGTDTHAAVAATGR